MTSTKDWINAMRLRTLPLSLSGIILGSAIAYSRGFWNWQIFILAIITTVFFQILSNFANDLGDGIKGTDNALRIGPERAVQSGRIGIESMKTGVIVMSILSFISAGTLIYIGTREMPNYMIWFYIILAGLAVLAAITYTIGKKAYGYAGFGDLMVLIFFGWVSVLGVYSLYAKSFLIDNLLPATTVGLLSAAVLNLNNMRDHQNDKKSNKKTLVVKIGPNYAKMYHAFLILGALVCMAVFINLNHKEIVFIALLPFAGLLYHLRKVLQTTNPKDFDPELKLVALLTFGVAVIYAITIFYSSPGL